MEFIQELRYCRMVHHKLNTLQLQQITSLNSQHNRLGITRNIK